MEKLKNSIRIYKKAIGGNRRKAQANENVKKCYKVRRQYNNK